MKNANDTRKTATTILGVVALVALVALVFFTMDAHNIGKLYTQAFMNGETFTANTLRFNLGRAEMMRDISTVTFVPSVIAYIVCKLSEKL